MAVKQIAWGDGSGQYITLSDGSGDGNALVAISSPPNNTYSTRTRTIRFSGGGISIDVRVSQPGLSKPTYRITGSINPDYGQIKATNSTKDIATSFASSFSIEAQTGDSITINTWLNDGYSVEFWNGNPGGSGHFGEEQINFTFNENSNADYSPSIMSMMAATLELDPDEDAEAPATAADPPEPTPAEDTTGEATDPAPPENGEE